MTTDIRLSTDFFRNIKIRKLKKQLGADGVLALQALWLWCAENLPSGSFGEKYSSDIEFIASWDGADGELLSALLELKLLNTEDDGTYSIHDWVENNPYAAAQEDRSAAGRLNRLKQVNPKAAQVFIDMGKTGLSNDEYRAARYANAEKISSRTARGAEPKKDNAGLTGQPSGAPKGDPGDTPGNAQGDPQGLPGSYTYTSTNTNINTKDNAELTRRPSGAPQGDPWDTPGNAQGNPRGLPGSYTYTSTNTNINTKDIVKSEAENQGINAADGPLSPGGDSVVPEKRNLVPIETVAELWNKMMPPEGFSAVQKITKDRRRRFNSRQRAFKARGAGNADFWRDVFDIVRGSAFLRGENDRRWRASFDFLVRSDANLTKILERQYDRAKELRSTRSGVIANLDGSIGEKDPKDSEYMAELMKKYENVT